MIGDLAMNVSGLQLSSYIQYVLKVINETDSSLDTHDHA